MKIILFALVTWASAQVQIAFLEMRDRDGKRIELEKGAPFSHVAISYQGKWLHTHPRRGVEVVSRHDLEKLGMIAVLITMPDRAEPDPEFVAKILGTPYEASFRWESDCFYCSKLVARIYDLKPLPMDFTAPGWPQTFQKYNGLPGISPQQTFFQLLKQGYRMKYPDRCEKIFQ